MHSRFSPLHMPHHGAHSDHWLTQEVPDGRMVWDNSAPEAAEFIHTLVNAPDLMSGFKVLSNHGNTALVRHTVAGETPMAIKDFDTGYSGRESQVGLPYYRVSAALHAGLLLVQDSLPDHLRRLDDVPIIYRAPRMYGGYIPNNPQRKAFSVMGRALTLRGNCSIPGYHMQRVVYNLALGAAGTDPSIAWLDGDPANAVPYFDHDKNELVLTRVDIHAVDTLPKILTQL